MLCAGSIEGSKGIPLSDTQKQNRKERGKEGGPILAFTFGAAANDKHMMWKGLRNEFVSALVVFACGLLLGAFFAPFGKEYSLPPFRENWN